MLDYYEFIEQLERRPAHEATLSLRMQGELATQPGADGGRQALAYLKNLVGRWTGRHEVADTAMPRVPVDDDRADALLESIEDSDADVRFVPDWAGEPLKTAA